MRKIGKKLYYFLEAISLILLFNCSVYAANNPIKNGFYMIQSGNADNLVLDINDYSMSNGGNLEIYKKNRTSNQIFYLQYRNNGYYTIRAVHSGYYLHKANGGKTDNVHQWEGYGANNTQWALESVGNGYYYIRNRSGNFLDNSGGRTALGNNVGTYAKNFTAAQKWKFISTKRPKFSTERAKSSVLKGTYNNNSSKTISGEIFANYPVTKLNVTVYNTSGTNMKMTGTLAPNSRNFSFKHTFDFSKLSAGNYYYRIRIWNVAGDEIATDKYNFSIRDSNPITTTTNKLRKTVVDYMNECASIRWTPRTTFWHWSGGRKWYAGTYYTGIPYTQVARTTTLERFEKNMSGNIYTGPAEQKTYLGSDCSSAVSMAYRKANSNFPIDKDTSTLFPQCSYMKAVGSYSYSGKNSSSICTENGKSRMKAAYADLQIGDLVLKRSGSGHVMMVTGKSNNSVTVTHQTTYNSSLKSTWRKNETWSFDGLYNERYIPVTLSTW